MLTVTALGLLVFALAAMALAKTLLSESRIYLQVMNHLVPLVIVVGLVLSLVSVPVGQRIPWPVVAYLGAPVVLAVVYGFWEWHHRHPGAISRGLVNLLGGRRRTPRKSKKQQEAEQMPRGRSYWFGLLPSWARTALYQDKPAWCVLHALLLTGGYLLALYLPETLPWFVRLLLPFVPAAVSFARWLSIDRARARVMQAYYGFASDHFGYKAAARDMTLPRHKIFSNPHQTVQIQWQEMTEPAIVQIVFPQSWEKTNMRKRDHFAREFEQTFQSRTVKKFLWDTGRQTVTIVAAHYPEDVRWGGQVTKAWHSFVIGTYLESEKPVVISVKNHAPHILVAGETGTGKTETMFVIVAQALRSNWTADICDPKSTGWVVWTRHYRYTNEFGPGTGALPLEPGDSRPGILWHAVELYGIHTVVQKNWDEVERRKRVNMEHNVEKSEKLPVEVRKAEGIAPHMLTIDEALSLFSLDAGGDEATEQRNELRKAILSTVLRIIVEARSLQLHIMLGFQRPDTKYLSGAGRDNIGIRISLGALKKDGKIMVFDSLEDVPDLPLRKDNVDPQAAITAVPGGKSSKEAEDTEDEGIEEDAVVRGRGQVRPGSGAPVRNFQSMWLGPNQADLDEFLPFPEDESEEPSNAPQEPLDPEVARDDSGKDPDTGQTQMLPVPDDAELEPAEEPETAPAGRQAPAADVTAAGAPAVRVPKIPALDTPDPFVVPADPWNLLPNGPASAPEPAPPAAAPETAAAVEEKDLQAGEDTGPSKAHAVGEVTAPEEVTSWAEASTVIDEGQGRVGYTAPVVWDMSDEDTIADGGELWDPFAVENLDDSEDPLLPPEPGSEPVSANPQRRDPEPESATASVETAPPTATPAAPEPAQPTAAQTPAPEPEQTGPAEATKPAPGRLSSEELAAFFADVEGVDVPVHSPKPTTDDQEWYD